MLKKSYIFQPIDSCFFRESRSSDAIGNSELGSVFPPPIRTLLGALRTSIGEQWHQQHGTNWRQFDQLVDLQKLIGYGDDLGPINSFGPFIQCNGQRYYPAPANLMMKANEDGNNIFFTAILGHDPVRCDIGEVLLASFPLTVKGLSDLAGAKPAEGYWVSTKGYSSLLNGNIPNQSELLKLSDFIFDDPRLGIARDNKRAGVLEGMLYQTRHLRLKENISIEIEVSGLPDSKILELPSSQLVRLGGEGRFASLVISDAPDLPTVSLGKNNHKIMIYFLTPMLSNSCLPLGIPKGFVANNINGCDVWEGEINDIKVRIWSVMCGKVVREGGWDLAKHQARAVQSYLPAGSVLFAEVIDGSDMETINKCLHGQIIKDPDTRRSDAYGRGQILIGQWFK